MKALQLGLWIVLIGSIGWYLYLATEYDKLNREAEYNLLVIDSLIVDAKREQKLARELVQIAKESPCNP